MYLKLKQFIDFDSPLKEGIYSDDGYEVVPRAIHIIEAKRVSYKRLRFKNMKDLYKKEKEIFPRNSYYMIFGAPEKEEFEGFFIDIFDDKQELVSSIVAVNCELYIMNNNGKTVDADHCRVNTG